MSNCMNDYLNFTIFSHPFPLRGVFGHLKTTVPKQSNNWLRDDSLRAQSLPPALALAASTATASLSKAESTKKHQAASSRREQRRPIADTTSEDERGHQKDKRSGTLDSAPIDRAKSFEYFPGECLLEKSMFFKNSNHPKKIF